jgi:hypothetical protein
MRLSAVALAGILPLLATGGVAAKTRFPRDRVLNRRDDAPANSTNIVPKKFIVEVAQVKEKEKSFSLLLSMALAE